MIKHIVKKIEYFWRYILIYPVTRIIIHNRQISGHVDLSAAKKLLIIRNDRIGDMIVTTPILKGLKEVMPHLYIGILANNKNFQIVKNNYNVDRIHILPSNYWKLWKEIKNIRNENYDLVFNFVFIRMTLGGILTNLIAPKAVKIGQGDQRYKYYYNKILSIKRHINPMVNVLNTFVREATGIDIASLNYNYEINIDDTSRTNVLSFLKSHNLVRRQKQYVQELPYIVFNLSVDNNIRKLSSEQIIEIGKYLDSRTDFRTILLHMTDDFSILPAKQFLIENTQCMSFSEHGDASLLEIASLIEGALAVITPDTSLVHFASAFKTPVLGFYATLLYEWLPYNVVNNTVVADKNSPVSSISVPLMIESVRNFLSNIPITNIIKE